MSWPVWGANLTWGEDHTQLLLAELRHRELHGLLYDGGEGGQEEAVSEHHHDLLLMILSPGTGQVMARHPVNTIWPYQWYRKEVTASSKFMIHVHKFLIFWKRKIYEIYVQSEPIIPRLVYCNSLFRVYLMLKPLIFSKMNSPMRWLQNTPCRKHKHLFLWILPETRALHFFGGSLLSLDCKDN